MIFLPLPLPLPFPLPLSLSPSFSLPLSPIPTHYISVSSPRSPKSPSAQSASTSSAAHSQSASVASEFGSIKKPSSLKLQGKYVFSSDDSNPNSPVNDSGKDSNTGSDHSNQSVTSDQRQMHLMSFDSPTSSKAPFDMTLAPFDPLFKAGADKSAAHQMAFRPTLRQTPSFDSLLMDTKGGTTSGNVSPNFFSTSPNSHRQTSPRSSFGTEHLQQTPKYGSSVRPTSAHPGKMTSYTSDGVLPSHYRHPHSPSQPRHRGNVSPSGSVRSLILTTGGYDSDSLSMCGFQSDSDATSTHSSLLDVREDREDPNPLLVPTPASLTSLDSVHFDFSFKF